MKNYFLEAGRHVKELFDYIRMDPDEKMAYLKKSIEEERAEHEKKMAVYGQRIEDVRKRVEIYAEQNANIWKNIEKTKARIAAIVEKKEYLYQELDSVFLESDQRIDSVRESLETVLREDKWNKPVDRLLNMVCENRYER